MTRSKFKAMLVVFFDIHGVLLTEWLPEGATVNQHYYIQVLKTLRERVRRKRPQLYQDGWLLHQDNAPCHTAINVKRFLAEKNIPVLEHPPYSPDLAPCDYWLFPKIKSLMKGRRFNSIEAAKTRTTELLQVLTSEDLQGCFAQWKIRFQRCIDAKGEYFEGDNK